MIWEVIMVGVPALDRKGPYLLRNFGGLVQLQLHILRNERR
jgi:hypothetical protein